MSFKNSLLIRIHLPFVSYSGGRTKAAVPIDGAASVGFAAGLASRQAWSTAHSHRLRQVEAFMVLSVVGYFAFALAGVLGVY